MMKYTFEIMKEYEVAFRGISVYSVSEDKKLMVDFVAVEELEDTQKAIDEAYQKGLCAGYSDGYDAGLKDGKEQGLGEADMREAVAYEKGLNEAWDAAREIAEYWTKIDNDELLAMFGISERIGHSTIRSLFEKQTAKEAMLNIEVIEEQKNANEEIKVGDEVEVLDTGNKYLIAWFAGKSLCGFAHDGVTCRLQPSDVRKTGRHFDIDKILEEMRE